MKDHEHNLQVACINWFKMQYPKLIIYAVANGGNRNIITAKKLKAEGVLAGVPDLHIPINNHDYNSLYIEMKHGRNKPTTKQKEIMRQLEMFGNKCVVCNSFDGFVKEVKEYLK